MTGKTHLVGGLAAGAVIGKIAIATGAIPVSAPTILGLVAVVCLASLLPDIDEPNSMVSNLPNYAKRSMRKRYNDFINTLIAGIFKAILALLNMVTQALSGLIRVMAGGHRGATHWLITAVALTVVVLAVAIPFGKLWYVAFFFAGYTSHLVLDLMTLSGLEIGRPFSKKKYHILPAGLRVRTGSAADTILGVGLLVLTLLVLMIPIPLG